MSSGIEPDKKFSIPGVTFAEEWDGFVVADVVNRQASAKIAINGAQLLSWQPVEEEPVIWLSDDARFQMGKSVRGGIPICWPWFGAHKIEPTFPQHGFARTSEWELVDIAQCESGATELTFCLNESLDTRHLWPHSFELTLKMRIGHELTLALKTCNCNDETIKLGEALHPYFNVSDIANVTISGLDGLHYLDKLEEFQRKRQSGDLRIEREIDQIYLDATADCLIDDSGFGRRVRISKSGSQSSVIWNPWQELGEEMGDLGEAGYRSMVCVESANAADNEITIAPGQSHLLTVRYQIEPLE